MLVARGQDPYLPSSKESSATLRFHKRAIEGKLSLFHTIGKYKTYPYSMKSKLLFQAMGLYDMISSLPCILLWYSVLRKCCNL